MNIDIYLTASTLRPYINVNYESIEKNADDIWGHFKKTFRNGKCLLNQIGYTTKYTKFLKWLDQDLEYSPSGIPIKEFFRKDSSFNQEHYIVFRLYSIIDI